jgi:methyl-accepting chemotaxis protein
MVSGETGYRRFHLYGTDYYVFFKPFERAAVPGRSLEQLNWSAGIVYPGDDIFGDYNSLLYYVLAIAFVGLLLLFLLCMAMIHRQLKPLTMLTEKAQLIAKGNYDEPIPDSRQADEVGRLQDNFQQMQRSLASNIGELEQLTATMKERGEGLRVAYNEAQKADRMKTAFLHNMTNQMTGPADAIDNDVDALCRWCEDGGTPADGSQASTASLADNIQQNGKAITELLNNLISLSDEDMRKEVAHD